MQLIYTKVLNALSTQYSIIILGGLSGRLDQTVHTMSYLHKLRKSQKQIFVISDDNVGWVLDSVSLSIVFFALGRKTDRSIRDSTTLLLIGRSWDQLVAYYQLESTRRSSL